VFAFTRVLEDALERARAPAFHDRRLPAVGFERANLLERWDRPEHVERRAAEDLEVRRERRGLDAFRARGRFEERVDARRELGRIAALARSAREGRAVGEDGDGDDGDRTESSGHAHLRPRLPPGRPAGFAEKS
jgi:hypothetical protein